LYVGIESINKWLEGSCKGVGAWWIQLDTTKDAFWIISKQAKHLDSLP
jgi:hypothetical protein